jgi:hypothetical protein
LGGDALVTNTTGQYNAAYGANSLRTNNADANTAMGSSSMYSNTTGSGNAGIGTSALYANTTGANNVALGYAALGASTTASNNTAVGYQAGYTNSLGSYNTLVGTGAGFTMNPASAINTFNTCIGAQSGYGLTTGTYNTIVGPYSSGAAITTGSKNTVLGGYSGNQGGLDIRTASNWIVISDGDGNPRIQCDSNGYFKVPTVYSLTSGSAANVFVDSSGYLYRSTSALKYKQDIRDLESIDINKFRPVRYKSKCEKDDQSKDMFGVIADEVDQAGITELVSYGAEGEVEGFQYERLTVVLLKAIQELKAEFDAYKATHP